MKHCAHVYTGPCHWCDRNTKQPPLKEAAFAVGDYCENTPIDQWDADEMAAIIKRELEKAVLLPKSGVCKEHGKAILVTHVDDGEPCSDFLDQ